LIYGESNHTMEFDVYIPKLGLAFEYQGIQHYSYKNIYGPPDRTARKDKEKENACKALGIVLVIVPYWWDKRQKSLMEAIKKHENVPQEIKDMLMATSSRSN
jgi:hypothetical protein